MGLTSTISSKGQITVPVEVRRRLGLREGDRVRFVVKDGNVTVEPDRPQDNPFEKFIGALSPQGQPDGTAVAWVRSIRDLEEDQ
jgi:AbrB family looped-hinge helix DNA binding protein